jgi:hypothetical protein
MTEPDWLACTTPWTMLEYVRTGADDRRLRLFACACCRGLWHLLIDERSREAVAVAELYADEMATAERLLDVAIAADGGADDTHGEGADVADTAADLASGSAWEGALAAAVMDYPAQRPLQANLFRDIFGNPFRPVTLDPAVLAWDDGTVVRLAQAAYEERQLPEGILDNGRLAVLADALEEAGCSDADILGHLRGSGPHVRGCWSVDLLLGKG